MRTRGFLLIHWVIIVFMIGLATIVGLSVRHTKSDSEQITTSSPTTKKTANISADKNISSQKVSSQSPESSQLKSPSTTSSATEFAVDEGDFIIKVPKDWSTQGLDTYFNYNSPDQALPTETAGFKGYALSISISTASQPYFNYYFHNDYQRVLKDSAINGVDVSGYEDITIDGNKAELGKDSNGNYYSAITAKNDKYILFKFRAGDEHIKDARSQFDYFINSFKFK